MAVGDFNVWIGGNASGAYDWSVAANWGLGTVPVTGEHVRFQDGSYSILAGLAQGAVSLASFVVTEGYSGTIGDIDNGNPLVVDVAYATANTPRVVLGGSGLGALLDGTMPTVIVEKGRGDYAAQLDGDIDDLYVVGSGVTGTVSCANSMVLDNLYIAQAPFSTVTVGTSVTSLDEVVMVNGGTCTIGSAVGVRLATTSGVMRHTAGTLALVECYGGSVYPKGSGTITMIDVYSGTVSWAEATANEATVTDCTVHGGTYTGAGAGIGLTHTNPIKVRGGSVVSVKGAAVDELE